MLTVIGKVGCTKCMELKDKLTREGIEFKYHNFDTMPRCAKQLYATIIRKENNGHFPLVLDNNGIIIQEGSYE